jgi:hypothetical protein
MLPIVMRLLGAAAPNTEEGTIVGHAIADPAATAEPFRNSRRLIVFAFLVLLLLIVFSHLNFVQVFAI